MGTFDSAVLYRAFGTRRRNIELGEVGLTQPFVETSTQENGLRVGDVIKDFSGILFCFFIE